MGKIKDYVIGLSEEIEDLAQSYDYYDYLHNFANSQDNIANLFCEPQKIIDYLEEIIANTKGCDDLINRSYFERAYGLKRKVERLC